MQVMILIIANMLEHGMKGLLGDAFAEVHFSLEYFLHCMLEFRHGFGLVKITQCSGSHASLCIELFTVGGVDQNLEIGIEGDQRLNELEPIFSNQLNLNNDQVRLVHGHFLHCFFSRGARPGDFPEVQFFNVV